MAIKTPIKKVMPLLNRGAFCLNTIEQTFLDYLPANKMSETANPDEADVFFLFLFANPDPPDVHITIPDSLKPNAPELNFTTLEKTVKTLNGILEKPRIFYMDCFGSKRPNPHQNTIPDYIKETDILVCPASLPDHPNAFTVGHYDERRFFVSGRYEREPNSALIMVDQVEVFGPMLFPLLDKIDKLFITGRDDFNSITGYQALKPYRDKIEMAMLTWPDGVRGFLNRAERVINLQWNLGPEFIGVEGAFCGTRPIYPDNAYYRDIFGDTPVTFYETENPESLCNAVLKSSPLTPDEINTFTKRFSCTLHVTSFWESVYQILSGEHNAEKNYEPS